ncbi:PASTA domain-containing protein [Streptomyces sp. N50]|uniref:PASTA domain-containing protein n=1 Tax=Streptomyces sp. N50 TaxID=3081765 RepID=UPI0029621899|nr:PASTA domain-containing protein [Streptomyces sp. N50]WOX13447.1 PASTA domain-containing protein [Streptomyces sp. N50]
MSSYDPRSSGCTPFEEELINAMNDFAHSTDSPSFDTAGMVHRTRRRRATLIAGIATALIVAGGGTALASMTGGTSRTAPAKPDTTATAPGADYKKAILLLSYSKEGPVAIDLTGMDLATAKGQFLKAGVKLGTVSEVNSPGCTPGSVVEVTPHAPKVVETGDTIELKLCGSASN